MYSTDRCSAEYCFHENLITVSDLWRYGNEIRNGYLKNNSNSFLQTKYINSFLDAFLYQGYNATNFLLTGLLRNLENLENLEKSGNLIFDWKIREKSGNFSILSKILEKSGYLIFDLKIREKSGNFSILSKILEKSGNFRNFKCLRRFSCHL